MIDTIQLVLTCSLSVMAFYSIESIGLYARTTVSTVISDIFLKKGEGLRYPHSPEKLD
jgi:hypothetical protein